MKKPRFALISLLYSILATSCFLFPGEEVKKRPVLIEPPERQLVFHKAERGNVERTIGKLAIVKPVREETLYFSVNGRLESKAVQRGAAVQKGDLLLSLETGDLHYQTELSRLDMERESILLEQMSRQLETNWITSFDYRIQEINFTKARLIYEENLKRVDNLEIKAPFSGTVTFINGSEGDAVTAFSPVAQLSDPRELELVVRFPASQIHSITEGMDVRIYTAKDRYITGKLGAVPSVEGIDRIEVPLLPDDPDSLELVNNRTYQLEIVVERKEDVLVLEKGMVNHFYNEYSVRIRRDDSLTVYESELEIGLEGDNFYEIISGLNEGDEVLTN